MKYEVGRQYELQTVGIRRDSAGYNYIALIDDEGDKEYRIYNILKCQYEGLPKTVYVKVTKIEPDGRVRFKQDEARLMAEHYKKDEFYIFSVTEIKEDYNTKAPYYIVEDDFSQHRFYFKDEQKFQVGDDCILQVDGITDKGFLKLKEYKGEKLQKVENSIPIYEGSNEDWKTEYKTSIAFPPGGSCANIDKQLGNIIRELAAFMNTEGGTLFIGIHDKNKTILGIKDDYAHLNEGEDDYNGTYALNHDGYELKIRNTIDRLCPSVANSLIDINFEEKDKAEFCRIDVRKAKRPIWMNGTQLYVRQGNRTKLFKGDEITFYITERMNLSIKEVIDTDDLGMMSEDKMRDILRSILNERRVPKIPSTVPNKVDEMGYWIIWYNDGKWKRARNKSEEDDVFIQLPVPKSVGDYIVVFCYDNGRVNVVKLADFRRGANLDKIQDKNAWCSNSNRPLNIFITKPNSYLAGYNVDGHEIEHVKIHSLTDFSPTASANNKGSLFVPNNCRITMYKLVGSEHHVHLSKLIFQKSQKANTAGVPLFSSACIEEFDYLANL